MAADHSRFTNGSSYVGFYLKYSLRPVSWAVGLGKIFMATKVVLDDWTWDSCESTNLYPMKFLITN